MISVLVVPPVLEPLTLTEAKLRAGLDWVAGDPRDGLMTSFLASARSKVETDTGLALLTQTRDVYHNAALDQVRLPTPVQSVTSITWVDPLGAVQTLDPTTYRVTGNGRVQRLSTTPAWPAPTLPYVLRLVVGYASVALLTAAEPMLVHLVGRLVAHYATLGRDLASVDATALVPLGYEEDIAPYRPVVVA